MPCQCSFENAVLDKGVSALIATDALVMELVHLDQPSQDQGCRCRKCEKRESAIVR